MLMLGHVDSRSAHHLVPDWTVMELLRSALVRRVARSPPPRRTPDTRRPGHPRSRTASSLASAAGLRVLASARCCRLSSEPGWRRTVGAEPGPDAIAAAWSPAPATRARQAGHQPRQPSQHRAVRPVHPSRATCRRSTATSCWLPNAAPAAQATPSSCRTSGRAVAGASADRRGQVTALVNPQLNAHDRLSGTQRIGLLNRPGFGGGSVYTLAGSGAGSGLGAAATLLAC
jgi:hypothetical protein